MTANLIIRVTTLCFANLAPTLWGRRPSINTTAAPENGIRSLDELPIRRVLEGSEIQSPEPVTEVIWHGQVAILGERSPNAHAVRIDLQRH